MPVDTGAYEVVPAALALLHSGPGIPLAHDMGDLLVIADRQAFLEWSLDPEVASTLERDEVGALDQTSWRGGLMTTVSKTVPVVGGKWRRPRRGCAPRSSTRLVSLAGREVDQAGLMLAARVAEFMREALETPNTGVSLCDRQGHRIRDRSAPDPE